MKLYIESIFDKDTNKIEDAKQKAIDAANNVEEMHGNLGAAKIYYFATVIDKLIIATGKTGAKAMGIKNQVLAIKEIPDIKLGDIPTKFAKYQELVIPAIDFKAKKVIFTKLKDMNGEDNIGAEFKLAEIPNNNPVYDWKNYKVEIIDEQPKFLKIEPNQTIWGKVSFMVGAFGTTEPSDRIKISINGDIIELSLAIEDETDSSYSSRSTAKIIKNNSQFYVDFEQVLVDSEVLNSQHGYYPHSRIAKVTLRGYFYQPLNISILGNTDEDFSNEAFGYIQKSLNLVDLKPFKIPAPYTNVATKVDGLTHQPLDIKKNKPFTDGITFGAVMSYKAYVSWNNFLSITNDDDSHSFIFHRKGGYDIPDITINNNNFDIPDLTIPGSNKPFYVQMSINFKSNLITLTIDDKSKTIEIPNVRFKKDELCHIVFGDNSHSDTSLNFISDMWYWIGDTSDIEDK